jgi:hypothetical protein
VFKNLKKIAKVEGINVRFDNRDMSILGTPAQRESLFKIYRNPASNHGFDNLLT